MSAVTRPGERTEWRPAEHLKKKTQNQSKQENDHISAVQKQEIKNTSLGQRQHDEDGYHKNNIVSNKLTRLLKQTAKSRYIRPVRRSRTQFNKILIEKGKVRTAFLTFPISLTILFLRPYPPSLLSSVRCSGPPVTTYAQAVPVCLPLIALSLPEPALVSSFIPVTTG